MAYGLKASSWDPLNEGKHLYEWKNKTKQNKTKTLSKTNE